MNGRMVAEIRPRNLAELIAEQRYKGMPGLEDDEFIEIVRELFAERIVIDHDNKLTRRQAEAQAAEFMHVFFRVIRNVMERYAAELTPWHAREWFLMAYENHQGFNDEAND